MTEFNPEQGDMIEVSDDIDTADWGVVPWEFICMRAGGYLCVLDENQDEYFRWPYARAIPEKKHLPKDILCEVWSISEVIVKAYSDGTGGFYLDGGTSRSRGATKSWDNYQVIENDPQPWFGGECPIPEGCTFKVFFCGGWHEGASQKWDWTWDEIAINNITAYQITGEIED